MSFKECDATINLQTCLRLSNVPPDRSAGPQRRSRADVRSRTFLAQRVQFACVAHASSRILWWRCSLLRLGNSAYVQKCVERRSSNIHSSTASSTTNFARTHLSRSSSSCSPLTTSSPRWWAKPSETTPTRSPTRSPSRLPTQGCSSSNSLSTGSRWIPPPFTSRWTTHLASTGGCVSRGWRVSACAGAAHWTSMAIARHWGGCCSLWGCRLSCWLRWLWRCICGIG
mmetsp:Transcript_56149/g.114821  ORF Transcript_56149/g.114821 Transcript_56149/m.114821 type:complete len:227 (-) Transcript_56149:2281-2961(-)